MRIRPDERDSKTWQEARRMWGKSHEIGMATEELAETIAAINHMRRDRLGSPEEFIRELADACVCSFQMVENNGWWKEFHLALAESFSKLDAKLAAHNKNEGHS